MKECKRLRDEYLEKGWTSRSNINPDYIKALKRCNKESAKRIAEAINNRDCKAVLQEMRNTSGINAEIRKISECHDKIIYDAEGKPIYWWNCKEQKTYQLEL